MCVCVVSASHSCDHHREHVVTAPWRPNLLNRPYLDDCCCPIRRWALVSMATCRTVPGAAALPPVAPPPLLNHKCCCAAPENRQTQALTSLHICLSKSEIYSPAHIWRAELETLPASSRPAYERYITLPKIAEVMRTPCVRMNRAFNFVVNHIKEAPMMTNAP